MIRQIVFRTFVIVLAASSVTCASNTIDLSGSWRLALDPERIGQQQGWYQTGLPNPDQIRLPGSLQEQGYGDPPDSSTPWTGSIKHDEWNKPKYAPYRTADQFKIPFWLQPERYYKGAAWIQKIVTIPPSWENRQITLHLERPHWQTTVWVDSNSAGSADSLSTPHRYNLSEWLSPGDHVLTIRLDNSEIIEVGINSHSISDHTQSNWNGIVGRVQLQSSPPVWIEDVQVYPCLETSSASVQVALGNRTGRAVSGQLTLEVSFNGAAVKTEKIQVAADSESTCAEAILPLGDDLKTWDEFNPNLYALTTTLRTDAGTDSHTTPFAMRRIKTEGSRIILNGRPVFLRGTLECCIFPRTGYPPADVQSWKRIVRICKAHGLNHIRFHSWCPPEAAFAAADELGFYYQVECGSWANYPNGQGIGSGRTIDRWLYDEADAILKAYGNHPSFLLLAYGNEPAGPKRGAAYLEQWVPHYRQKDPRRLVTGGSGWPIIEPSDFHVSPTPRIQAWGQELNSRINRKPPETVTDYRTFVSKYPDHPVIAHEIGQWCVYPNFEEIQKYTGVLKPRNFEIFRDLLEQKHMADQARDFLMASGKLQTLCYKEEIESALRTPHFGGFQLLDLHDFPGQGTALVGVLDPFWDSKPYVSPAEYSRFCNAIVPLLRLPKRIFTSSETLSAEAEVSQFGPDDLTAAAVQWALLDAEGDPLRQGILRKDRMPAGDLYSVGRITLPLSDFPVPAKYSLKLNVKNTEACNHWDIWIYPDTVPTEPPQDVILANAFDESVIRRLENGAKVLLAIDPAQVNTNVKLGFSSIFWNTVWTEGQAPHTLGILCDPKHPALAAFPTEYHSNWQWSDPVRHAAVIEMDALPPKLRPIVQVVPDWFEPKRLGLLFEAKVGKGSLLVCSIDILSEIENRPVERQLRLSLLNYMHSKNFRPDTEIKVDLLKPLFHESAKNLPARHSP